MPPTHRRGEDLAGPAPSEWQQPEELSAGTRLGEYVIQGRLGTGGMGTVYEGLDPVIGRRVAIKLIRSDLAGPGDLKLLLAEALACSSIRHRGIIQIFGFGETRELGPYMVMECLHGVSLDRLISERAPLPPDEVVSILDEALLALKAAHAAGVVHRDLKPSNIFLATESDGSRCVKLLDFGLAKRGALPGGALPESRGSVVVGTPEYMSPEQAEGRPADGRSDLYSLGMVAFQMLTGKLPFTGGSALEIAVAQIREVPPPPSGLFHSAVLFDSLVLAMLEKDPRERPASTEAVRAELKRIARELALVKTASGWRSAESETVRQPAPSAPATRLVSQAAAPAPAPGQLDIPLEPATPARPRLKLILSAAIGLAAASVAVIAYSSGNSERAAAATLVPATAPSEPPTPRAEPAPVPQPAEPLVDAPQRSSVRETRRKPVQPSSGPTPNARPGVLGLTVIGCWANVSIDGKSVRRTPLPALELPAGRHRLVLDGNPYCQPHSAEIVIDPGKTLRYEITLKKLAR